jgi:hypothetical protein
MTPYGIRRIASRTCKYGCCFSSGCGKKFRRVAAFNDVAVTRRARKAARRGDKALCNDKSLCNDKEE